MSKSVTKITKNHGRPSSYKPEYDDEIIKYFSVYPYIEIMKKVVTKVGVVEIPTNEASDFPSFAGFASKIGVCRDTINEWTRVHKSFSDAHKKAKELQENWLVTNGMKGLVDTAFAIFTAKNVLKWTDRQDLQQKTEHVISDESAKNMSELAQKILDKK